MSNYYDNRCSHINRTILKVLKRGGSDRKIGVMLDGRFYSGTASTHLSKTGRQYARLLRIQKRFSRTI